MRVTKSHLKRCLNLTVSVKSNPDFHTMPATWLHIRKGGSILSLFSVAKKQVLNDFDLLSTRNPIWTTRLEIGHCHQPPMKLYYSEIELLDLEAALLMGRKCQKISFVNLFYKFSKYHRDLKSATS